MPMHLLVTCNFFTFNLKRMLFASFGEEGEDDARSACPLIPWATHIIQSPPQRAATG